MANFFVNLAEVVNSIHIREIMAHFWKGFVFASSSWEYVGMGRL
jgi:hypothetical protein